MNSKKEIVIVDKTYLENKIYIIRGQKVMLDRDLAEIYGYSTKDFNKQVKNNILKFKDDFMFHLSNDELTNLRWKNSTSNWGGTRYRPYAFTVDLSNESRHFI